MISQDRYIKIVSGVGGATAAAQRQLILRLITQNSLLPPGLVLEAGSLDAVVAFFGINSEEYRRARDYFAFVSKNITSPQRISYARWVNAPIAPMVIGDTEAKNLVALKAISAGTLSLTTPSGPVNVSGVSLTAATSLTQVAAILQTALRASADPQLTTANVTYNTNTNQFSLTGTVTGSGSISITPTGLATDMAPLLGWGTVGTVYAPGQAGDTAVAAVQKSSAISNNMGVFAFCTPAVPMTNTDIEAVAAWNHAQNNTYIYTVATSISNLAALFNLVKGRSGTALNVISTTLPNDFIEQSVAEIAAATDYSRLNATQSYMYYQFAARNITVSDDATADVADTNRGNYIGVTQSAGQPLAFYQRGVLCGGVNDATDMNVYVNEMWLKSYITAQLISLFVALPEVPADQIGQGMILGALQQAVDKAKDNGTISNGKTLTELQKRYISQVSGDQNAWRQVSTIGYWLSVDFLSFTSQTSGLTEWKAVYTLIYSKKDSIRVVNGSDILI